MSFFFIYLIIINLVAYVIMWIDKLKSIYKWWRISEKTLWILVCIGGVFGVWLGMMAPIYHKAGKQSFRTWIPVFAMVWVGIILYFFSKNL